MNTINTEQIINAFLYALPFKLFNKLDTSRKKKQPVIILAALFCSLWIVLILASVSAINNQLTAMENGDEEGISDEDVDKQINELSKANSVEDLLS